MVRNSNLINAKRKKNDEFYTRYEDIEKELVNYKNHFENKIIYCNCDNPNISNFFKYFVDNFNDLKLKKVIATSYNDNGKGIKGIYEGNNIEISELEDNGSFDSKECIDILNEADLIITNPPFSKSRTFIKLLMIKNKKFIIINNINAITYKEIFPYIKENKIWFGINQVTKFIIPDSDKLKGVQGRWFTNLKYQAKKKELILTKKYNPDDYPNYDNYEAINVDRIKDIPFDYTGAIGVPITFLDWYDPNQFNLIKFRKGLDNKDLYYSNGGYYNTLFQNHYQKETINFNLLGIDRYIKNNPIPNKRFTIRNKEKFTRIIIQMNTN